MELTQYKTLDGVRFGKELRERDFLFEKGYLNLNHGSFGTYPQPVRTAMRQFQDRAESHPDKFIRYDYPSLLDESREAMANLLSVPSPTIVLIPNATTGLNTILRSLSFPTAPAPPSYILYFSCIYGAVEKTIAYITETTPALSHSIPIAFPCEDAAIVASFDRAVADVRAKGGNVKVAVFDAVVSMPGVRMPFEELVRRCREMGVLSVVDGAHGVGHVGLRLGDGEGGLDADFFVSNCHKWLHVPRGTAILHVPLRNQHLIRSTLPTSHGFSPKRNTIASPLPRSASTNPLKTPWVANFEFVGTIDNAPYLCIPAALAYRASLGGEDVIRAYCFALARKGGAIVAKRLGTEVMDNETHTLTQCCMSNVRLPISLAVVREAASAAGVEEKEVGGAVRDWMSKVLIDEYGTFVQSLFYGGAWWARVSAQVYLEEEDFEWAGETLGKVCERVERGEWIGEGKESKL